MVHVGYFEEKERDTLHSRVSCIKHYNQFNDSHSSFMIAIADHSHQRKIYWSSYKKRVSKLVSRVLEP